MSAKQITVAYAKEQLDFCRQAYGQVRPGSRAAAEICRDYSVLRTQLAMAIRAERLARRCAKGGAA